MFNAQFCIFNERFFAKQLTCRIIIRNDKQRSRFCLDNALFNSLYRGQFELTIFIEFPFYSNRFTTNAKTYCVIVCIRRVEHQKRTFFFASTTTYAEHDDFHRHGCTVCYEHIEACCIKALAAQNVEECFSTLISARSWYVRHNPIMERAIDTAQIKQPTLHGGMHRTHYIANRTIHQDRRVLTFQEFNLS